jgi:chromosome segregation protein
MRGQVFLRSLTVRGFKSFADKTTLEFTPGVSVIVGPNGSGKSNIADAFAWVLGEQGVRALRGAQMTDVIFAGSPARPALGLAEVKLVIDNSAGLIPVPATEIEISRAVFRSGESEYRLGGRPCRLLDIQELLSDSGLGRALHTIVSQGHLEDVLAARPEERRQFIEEAAGIAKHRRRRERAERKLAGLEQDLLRLNDVAAELKRQLKPLKQQAELAGRHEALTGEATDLARDLAAARLRSLYRDRERRQPSWQEVEARQEEARARLAELDAEIARLDAELSEAEGARRRAEDLQVDAVRAKSEAEDSLRGSMREEGRARERLQTAMGRSGRLFALQEELALTEHALADVRGTFELRETELEEAEATYRRETQARRDAEEERRRAGEESARHLAVRESLERTLAGYQTESERLASSLEEVRARIGRLSGRATELEGEVERLDALASPPAEEQSKLERERAELAATLSELGTKECGLLARQEIVDAHVREMSESPGAAFLGRRPERALGLLRDLLGVPPHLTGAVRGVLGPFADAVAYARREDALADAVAESASGLTLAVALEDGPGPDAIAGERALLDALRPDARVGGLARRLLSGVYLVHNLAEAATKHRVHPAAQFVTPEGAVVGPAFVRVAAGQDARLEKGRRESAALERELAGFRRGLREGRRRMAEITERSAVVSGELETLDRTITTTAEEMGGVEADLSSLRREEQLVAERFAQVEVSAHSARDQLAELPAEVGPVPPALPPFPEAPMHLRVEVEALRRERARLETGVTKTRGELHELSSEDPVALRDALQEAEAARGEAEERLRNAEGNLAGALAAHRASTERARDVQGRHAEANRSWREQAAEVEAIRTAHEEEDRARLDLERRIGEAEALLREGHGVEPGLAVEELGEADTAEDLQRRADVVGRRLALLGKVNLLATTELEPLQQRHDFLVREIEDIKAARRDLQEVIHEVDRRMGELYASAFRDVATEFSGLFAELFPGGEGRLILTDPDDPLGSGVDVEARPGRKRVKRLTLLSGGERSLAALAFLFAIFRARPSPFYLMDEVEAALDDVNLQRFLEVMKSFAERSQMLIVTHQKRTMEMADVLYGVSMGKDGASKVISQRLGAEVRVG